MKKFGLVFAALISIFGVQSVLAAEGSESSIDASLKAFAESKIPGLKVKSITKTPYGLYEIYGDGGIVYLDEKKSFFFFGNLVDSSTMSNITQTRNEKLNVVDISTLDKKNAIKYVHGKGERSLITFEDPNCGYCKKIYSELEKLENVTISVFPIAVLGEASDRQARAIWCSKDRAKAWTETMTGKYIQNSNTPVCDSSAIDANMKTASQIGVKGTPTLFLASGKRIPGYVNVEKLNEALSLPENAAK